MQTTLRVLEEGMVKNFGRGNGTFVGIKGWGINFSRGK